MATAAYLGIDIGTSSSKAVLVAPGGEVIAARVAEHDVRRSGGRVEMDGSIWWQEFQDLSAALLEGGDCELRGIGVSGMGPCVLLTDEHDEPVAPSALYGVDTRATAQIDQLDQELGRDEILARGDSHLSTQAVGPKLRWFAQEMPEEFRRARRLHMPASYLVAKLTGEYVLDRQSASQCTPLFDAETQQWYEPWWNRVAGHLKQPRLAWAGEVAGTVSAQTHARMPHLPAGIPVIAGTIDAWAEGLSVGATRAGDLMLMYGTTMFLIANTTDRVRHPALWGTTGIAAGQRNLAGGMATSGAITAWVRDLTGRASWEDLIAEAEASGAGAGGLLVLPYFAGERTPIQDPRARGVLAGLTLEHTRGDIYRAALEATAFAVRHNLEALADAGVTVDRVVGVGGGVTSDLWPQLVSDVTGLPQHVPERTIGAAYGDAFLAARTEHHDLAIDDWNPVRRVLEPRSGTLYDELYESYRELGRATMTVQHHLADHGRPR